MIIQLTIIERPSSAFKFVHQARPILPLSDSFCVFLPKAELRKNPLEQARLTFMLYKHLYQSECSGTVRRTLVRKREGFQRRMDVVDEHDC